MSKLGNQLALLSIHIHKTAGTSFFRALQEVYGRDAVLRLDFTLGEDQGLPVMLATHNTPQSLLDQINSQGGIGPEIRVVHGHFRYDHFSFMFDLLPETKVVSWLRDPVDRMLSGYNYSLANLEKERGRTARAQRMSNNREMDSLLNFARASANVNVYRRYLGGRALADYDFLGITEYYEEELLRLAPILGVENVPCLHVNAASKVTCALSAQEREEVVRLYQDSILMYEQAQRLRESGLGRSGL